VLLKLEDNKPSAVWYSDKLKNHCTTSVYYKGHIYGFDGMVNTKGKSPGSLNCIDIISGKLKWSNSDLKAGGVLLSDGKLIIQADGGELLIAKADSEKFNLLAKCKPLEGRCWNMPVLSNGLIYTRNFNGNLVCINPSGSFSGVKTEIVDNDDNPFNNIPVMPGQEGKVRKEVVTKQEENKGKEIDSFQWPNRKIDKSQITQEGKSKISNDKIICNNGKIIFKNAGKQISDMCKKTNSLKIKMSFKTEDLKQKGPARILSLSQDPMKRNFTIGQSGDKLVLRLRTTKTGTNGTNPEVTLTDIKANRTYKIELNYSPGKLQFSLNGKKMNVPQIEGDFSNWDNSHGLVIGNEFQDQRPWNGTVYNFEIESN
jgi:hypothetical protein